MELGAINVDDSTVSTSRVYHDCVLDIFQVRFSIDIFPILMGDVYVIAGVDWLRWFRGLNNCNSRLVVVCTPSAEDLTIYGKGTRVRSTFCFVVKDKRYLQHVCL